MPACALPTVKWNPYSVIALGSLVHRSNNAKQWRVRAREAIDFHQQSRHSCSLLFSGVYNTTSMTSVCVR